MALSTNKSFYELISNEDSLNKFLIDNCFYDANIKCTCINSKESRLRLTIKKRKKNKIIVMTCTNRSCNKWYPTNIFKLNSSTNLKQENVLEIIWHWAQNKSALDTAKLTGRDSKTVQKWNKKLRQICTYFMMKSAPMGGPGYELQIDESLFQGKRKYHRGRILAGNYINH